jgi:beta-glucosidase
MTILVPFLLAAGMTQAQAPAGGEPFRDTKLPLEQRVNDLVSRLTLDEKIALLGQRQPAIPRLGIKSFTNFTEGLHGLGWVAGGGVTATQFPQEVGLGETWDTEILRQAGAVEGYEARVYFKKFEGNRVGLAIRAPNTDLARDPRWGRTEESYGEDPYLVGKMSVGYIKGMQGDDPKYLLSAATMKHFLANSNEEARTRSSSDMDERNLREYYLVPFRMGIEQANAQSFMASYNAVNKIPDTVSPFLRNIVEKEWKFDGMICTDAGSLPNLTRQFHYYDDATGAVVGAVKAGITVFLDQYTTPLKDALDKKLLTEADIERNIKGNLRMRMRLGEFDPPEMVPYSKIAGTEEPWYSDKTKALARKATQESIVLLKNAGGLLPLDKAHVKSIALIGPGANDVYVDWYGGIPPYTVTPLEGIRNKVGPGVRVRYIADNSNNNDATNMAAESDVAIVFIGNKPTCLGPFGGQCPPSEGKEAVDRKAIALEPAQVQLVQRIKQANPRTIVVLKASFPYAMGAVEDTAPAILHMAHSSQEEGNALADVLFGDYNPAGRLPGRPAGGHLGEVARRSAAHDGLQHPQRPHVHVFQRGAAVPVRIRPELHHVCVFQSERVGRHGEGRGRGDGQCGREEHGHARRRRGSANVRQAPGFGGGAPPQGIARICAHRPAAQRDEDRPAAAERRRADLLGRGQAELRGRARPPEHHAGKLFRRRAAGEDHFGGAVGDVAAGGCPRRADRTVNKVDGRPARVCQDCTDTCQRPIAGGFCKTESSKQKTTKTPSPPATIIRTPHLAHWRSNSWAISIRRGDSNCRAAGRLQRPAR